MGALQRVQNTRSILHRAGKREIWPGAAADGGAVPALPATPEEAPPLPDDSTPLGHFTCFHEVPAMRTIQSPIAMVQKQRPHVLEKRARTMGP